jgi:hypothetical protein
MKFRVISTKSDIENIDKNDEYIHFAFRPSNTDIFNAISNNPDLKAIQIPSSYMKTLSKSMKMFFDIHNVSLIEGDIWGHRKDINEYYEVPDSVYKKLREMVNEGLSEDKIIEKMSKETRLDPDFIRFLLNHGNY